MLVDILFLNLNAVITGNNFNLQMAFLDKAVKW